MKLTPEYRFDPIRKWRFDYANIEHMVAIEIEGGAWTNGRHTRGNGFINDMEKYNAAIMQGWRILRYTPQQFALNLHIRDIAQLLINDLQKL